MFIIKHMHYLEGHFDSALGRILGLTVPTHRYISVHDLFNPELFHACLLATIANVPELAPYAETLSLATMVKEGDSASQGYLQLRLHNFSTVVQVMAEAFEALSLSPSRPGKQALFRLVKHCDLDQLQLLLQLLFELLIRNREIVEFITTLPQEDQFAIKDFLQRAKARQQAQQHEQAVRNEQDHERARLQEENTELRNVLAAREGELQNAQHMVHQLKQTVAELRELQSAKEAHIDGLKRRLLAYEETDSLFQEKDEEIFKLQKQLGELQVAHRLLVSESKTEKQKLQTKNAQLQRNNLQLQGKCDRLCANYESLQRQREDAETSNKRVLGNLRDRIKSLTDRVNELQDQLVEARIGRELREREYSQLMSNFQSLKSQNSDPLPRPREQSMDRLLLANSSSGHGKEFLRLQEELNELGKLKDNAFEEQIMMFESGEDNLKKVQEIINENVKLKERVAALEARAGRETREENEKLRKRLAVMKKRNQQLETQKREELELMISAIDALGRFAKE